METREERTRAAVSALWCMCWRIIVIIVIVIYIIIITWRIGTSLSLTGSEVAGLVTRSSTQAHMS